MDNMHILLKLICLYCRKVFTVDEENVEDDHVFLSPLPERSAGLRHRRRVIGLSPGTQRILGEVYFHVSGNSDI